MKTAFVVALFLFGVIARVIALNDNCRNAVTLDPFSDAVVSGDTTLARRTTSSVCGEAVLDKGLWYKIPSNTTMGIIVSTCYSATSFDTKISIYKGDRCGNLECVVVNDDANDVSCGASSRIDFFATEPSTYWIFVYGSAGAVGELSLSLSGASNYFALINAQTDQVIGPLTSDHYYSSASISSRLNIRAFFDPEFQTKSVLVSFDKPPRSFCEKQAPFSVFGDVKGNYKNATIPVGGHTVTATPFAQANCQGPPGWLTLTQSFIMVGCPIIYEIIDASDDSLFDGLYYEEMGNVFSRFPCQVNINAFPDCGFDIYSMRLVLRDTANDKVIYTYTDRLAPYYLFGEDPTTGDVASGFIPPGTYSLVATIDGIEHPAQYFSVLETCSA